VIPTRDLVEKFNIPEDAVEEHLSLLNLVNFGGGCYAVYAELHGDEVRVDKELFGDTFRRAPRLTPLEARAIRLALEFVGPLIAAGAHSPLERVRQKLEETFGEFDLQMTPEPQEGPEEAQLATLNQAIREHRLVEVDYMKEGEDAPSTRQVEPYRISRELPHWYVHTWSRTSGGERSFRLDRLQAVRLLEETFEPRPDFEGQFFRGARSARVWYSPTIARWEVEKGAQPLVDGAALSERAVGSPEWLVGEILSFRGQAEVLEPADLRKRVARRAAELEKLLGKTRTAR
jgi:proteasome accessory factor BC